jgi:hypothetical protein
MRVTRALCGLRESARLFFRYFFDWIRRTLGFALLCAEECLYILRVAARPGFLLLCLHAHDLILADCDTDGDAFAPRRTMDAHRTH